MPHIDNQTYVLSLIAASKSNSETILRVTKRVTKKMSLGTQSMIIEQQKPTMTLWQYKQCIQQILAKNLRRKKLCTMRTMFLHSTVVSIQFWQEIIQKMDSRFKNKIKSLF